MMKRRIFPWMGLIVLFLILGFGREILAQESYRVKRGDTIARVAKKFAVSQEALLAANHLQGTRIRYKQVLIIPATKAKQLRGTARGKKTSPRVASSSYTVRKGDTLSKIARKTGVSVATINEINHLRRSALKPGQKIILAKAEPLPETMAKPAETDTDEDEDSNLDGEHLGTATPAEREQFADSSAEVVGKWNNPEEKRLFVKVATAFLGAPYRWGGVSLRGLDCSAFVKKIYELFDVSLPRTAREQAHVGAHVAREDLREGDLVFFNTKRSFGHVGIYIGDNKFVHASSGNRVIKIDSLDESYFNKRFVRAVRLKGDAEFL